MQQTAQLELLSGALDNLIRYTLTGCSLAGHRAAMLLDRLGQAQETDAEMQDACQRMREHLEHRHV